MFKEKFFFYHFDAMIEFIVLIEEKRARILYVFMLSCW